MSDSDNQRELLNLIDLQIDGEASKEQVDRLAEILHNSVEARLLYQEYFNMQADLYWNERGETEVSYSPEATMLINDEIGTERALQSGDASSSDILENQPTDINEVSSSPILRFLSGCYKSAVTIAGSQLGLSLSVALLSMFSLIITLALIYPETWRPTDQGADNVKANSQLIAKVTFRKDCVWSENDPQRRWKDAVLTGERLSLKKGTADILLQNGVLVTLHSPVDLKVSDLQHCELTQGFLEIHVPQGSEGYTVNTFAANIVDLGTKFIVGAEGTGATEVHVLKGAVEVHPNASKQRQNIRKLTINQSMRIATSGKVVSIPPIGNDKISKTRYAFGQISITNPSFELPVLKVFQGGKPQGWTVITSNNQINQSNGCRRPRLSEFSKKLPHGLQFGYVQRGRTLQQTLKHALLPNREYQFAVSLGKRKDANKSPIDYRIDLLAGDEVIATDKGTLLSKITNDSWHRLKLNFQVKAKDRAVGKKLTIRFKCPNPNAQQTTIDDVALFVKKMK